MTAIDPPADTLETAGEPTMAARAAGGCVIGALSIGGAALIVRTAPETAYVIVGSMLTVGWQRGRAWHTGRRDAADEAPQPADETADAPGPDVADALRTLAAEGGSGVLLTRLRDHLGLPADRAGTKTVKALLDEVPIPTRAGVRTPHGSGPGVHRDDIPPPPPDEADTPVGGCLCRSDANTNANNTPEKGAGEGIRVEPIGNGHHIVRHPADTARHHTTRT
ncbi:hypothetical protein LUW75_10805 [Streptomyces sp. MRC013]|uniref:hypothetical protein n=1 Tax=Streptomyces sp. MRC013 TaxID=2898276 RepID=UPI0020270260|nr:hypothetical protein [Streptomyces sp. MRC013]URM90403.1 hypothetical protein LUW75_10805 [Streptomyces sp. MRC013]